LTIAYNAFGRIESILDSADRQTAYQYDDRGEYLEQVTYDDGTFTRDTYDAAGGSATRHSLLSVQTAGVTRHFRYDARGRLDQHGQTEQYHGRARPHQRVRVRREEQVAGHDGRQWKRHAPYLR
jgi:YD repeat-containing protein